MKPADLVIGLIMIVVMVLGGYYLIRHPDIAEYDAQQGQEGKGR